MHDNACPNYEDIIEDYYYGHRWLKRHFIRMPKIGWHVDPFGHSASLPILLDKMGFMGLVINRIHHRDKRNRGDLNHLDFVWSPTPKTSLLTHILSDHYSPPDSLN
jgi:lysosomal alpha-mannosidase